MMKSNSSQTNIPDTPVKMTRRVRASGKTGPAARTGKIGLACHAGLLLLISLSLVACDAFNQVDLRVLAQKDVDLAHAASRKVTITSVASGITSPAGSLDVKEGFAQTISTQTEPEYVLVGWRQTGGAGTAVFTALDTSRVEITVTGGDVVIEPVYEVRPIVLYSTPIGNSIAKNSSVRVIFNRAVDLDGLLETQNEVLVPNQMVTLSRQGTEVLPWTLRSATDSTSVAWKPENQLADYVNYVLTVKSGIKAAIDFTAPSWAGVTFLNQEVVSRTDYTEVFQTGDKTDNIPPVNGRFNLSILDGNAFYSHSQTVHLDQFQAVDDSGEGGVAWVYIKNETSSEYGGTPLAYAENLTADWLLSSSADGEYTVGVAFEDQNGNRSSTASAVEKKVWVDTTGPTVNTFAITDSAAAPGFWNSLQVSLSLSALDPSLGSSGVPGSGESPNGTDLADQKTMRFSLDGTVWTEWESFATSRNLDLAAGADGVRTVQTQVRDGVGNVTTASATILLDTTPPTLDFTLAGNAVASAGQNIQLAISAEDPVPAGSLASGLASLELSGSSGLEADSAFSASLDGVPVSTGLNLAGQSFPSVTIPYADSLNLRVSTGDGLKTIGLLVRDQVGNPATISRTINLDTTPPDTASVIINGGAAITSSNQVSLTLSAADHTAGTGEPGTGIALVGLQAVEGANPTPDVSMAQWFPYSTTLDFTLQGTSNGEKQTVYAWFQDGIGNKMSTPVSTSITYSSAAPSVNFAWGAVSNGTVVNNPALVYNWSVPTHTAPITKVEATSNSSTGPWLTLATPGINTASGSGTWDLTDPAWGGSTANGYRYFNIRVTDSFGRTTVRSIYIWLDTTAPVVTGYTVYDSDSSSTAWTNSTGVKVGFNISDNKSTAAAIQYELSNTASFAGSWTACTAAAMNLSQTLPSGDGTKTVYLRAKDALGNISPTYSCTLGLDTVVPVISSVSINSGASATNSQYLSVALSTSDGAPASGVVQMRVSSNGGAWTTWQTLASSFTWDMADTLYGGSSTEGSHWVYAQIKDAAGNLSTAAWDGILFDTVAPTPGTLTFGSSIYYSRTMTVTNHPTDAISGVAWMKFFTSGVYTDWIPYTSTYALWAAPLEGAKWYQACYKDAAGNVSTWTTYQSHTAVSVDMYWTYLGYAQLAAPTLLVGDYSTAYMANGLGSPITLSSTTSGFYYPIAALTEAGRVGKLKYTLSGTTIALQYITYNTDGTEYSNASGSQTLVSGTNYYVNMDNTIWNIGTSNPNSGILTLKGYSAYYGDFRLYYDGASIQLYPLETAKFQQL